MAITGKVVTVEKLGHFKEKTDEVYATIESVSAKAEQSELEKYLKKEEIDANMSAYVKDEELTTELLPYAKTEDIASTYAKKEDVAKLGTIQGTCTQEDLEGKKEGASVGDVWVVTDDENHMHAYNGTDFIDCGSHIDLGPYAQTETVNGQLALKADKTELDAYVKSDTLQEATEGDIDALFQA